MATEHHAAYKRADSGPEVGVHHSQEQDSPKERHQLSIRDALWLTTAIALVLAYARSIGPTAINHALVYALFALTCGSTIGLLGRNLRDAVFWAAVIALLAFLAVAGGRLPNEAIILGWGAVGACCGAICGLPFPKNLIAGTLVSGLIGAAIMILAMESASQAYNIHAIFDIASAGFVGMLLRPFVQFLVWFETRSKQPRIVLVSWLTLCVLFGNFLVPILGGVQR